MTGYFISSEDQPQETSAQPDPAPPRQQAPAKRAAKRKGGKKPPRKRFSEITGVKRKVDGKPNPEYNRQYHLLRPLKSWRSFIPDQQWDNLLTLLSGGCNICLACKEAGISRVSFYNRMHCDKKFARAVEDAMRALVPLVRDALVQSALNGNFSAQKFFLQHRAPGEWGDKAKKPDAPDRVVKLVLNQPTPAQVAAFNARRAALDAAAEAAKRRRDE
jgi:hypothetical protein